MYWGICSSYFNNPLFHIGVRGCVSCVAVNFRDLLFCVCCGSSTGSAVLCLAVWRFLVWNVTSVVDTISLFTHLHLLPLLLLKTPWRPTSASKHSCEWFPHRVVLLFYGLLRFAENRSFHCHVPQRVFHFPAADPDPRDPVPAWWGQGGFCWPLGPSLA